MPISPNQETLEYAGFWPRLIAYLIDLLIVGLVMFLIRLFVLNGLESVPFMTRGILFDYSVVDIVLYLLKVSYFVICLYCTQTTIGKYAMKLKVVNKNGEKLSLFSIIYRETIGRFLSSILYIGYLLIIIDKEKTALHDLICDSRVIYGCNVKKTVFVRTQPAPPYYQQMPANNAPPSNNMGPMGGRPSMGNVPPFNPAGPAEMPSMHGPDGMSPIRNMPPSQMPPMGNDRSNQGPAMGNMPPVGYAPSNEWRSADNLGSEKIPTEPAMSINGADQTSGVTNETTENVSAITRETPLTDFSVTNTHSDQGLTSNITKQNQNTTGIE